MGKVESETIYFGVQQRDSRPPQFLNGGPDNVNIQSGMLGGTVTVKCEAAGNGHLTFSWTKESGDKKLPGDRAYETEDHSLVIKHFERSDAGYYACTVTNEHGWTSKMISVSLVAAHSHVPTKPPPLTHPPFKITNSPEDQTVYVGDDVMFDCEIQGPIDTALLWYDGIVKADGPDQPGALIGARPDGEGEALLTKDRRFFIYENGTLSITNVTLKDNKRSFVCQGYSNTAGVISSSATLTVNGLDSDASGLPTPSVRPLVQIDRDAMMFLHASSGTVYIPPNGFFAKRVTCITNKKASISWVYDDGVVLDPALYGIMTLNDTASAMDISRQLFVNVPGRLTILQIHCQAGNISSTKFLFQLGAAPSVETPPVDQTVNEGADFVEFNCIFSMTVPVPTVGWIFTNSDGHMQTLQEQTLLSGTRTSITRISSISRDKSGRYDCVVENEFDKVTSSAHLTVQYFDGVGLSVIPSNELVYKTNGTLVINVSSVPAATEIRLSRNNVVFFSSSKGNLNRAIGTVIVNENNHIQYIFTIDKSWNTMVTAYAEHPLGSNTSTQVITVLGPIDVSVNTSCYNNNNSLLVKWTVYSNGGHDISNYTLRWRKGCSNTPTTLLNSKTWMVSGNARFTQQGGSYRIPGLDGNTTYCIDVEATNSIGPMSTTVKATTLSVPNQPELQCNPTLTTNTSVAMTWVVSGNGGDDVSHYTVVLSEDLNFTLIAYSKTLFVVDNSELTQKGGMVTVPGLSGGTTYYAKVVARNCVGASVSATQSCSTRCGPLLQPRAAKEVFLSDATITLTVKAPDLNCQIDKYIVKDVASADELQSSSSVENGIVTITITGLEAGANYTVQVYTVHDQSQERPIGKPVTFLISSQDKGEEKGLSSDVVGGVAAAVVLAIILIIAGVIICLYRKKRDVTKSTRETSRTVRSLTYEDPLQTPISDTAMQQSSTNGVVGRERTAGDSEVKMQESRAYATIPMQVATTNATVSNL
ncbi:uncharacterized protein LOC134177381 isoform X2 [Corticium candelabrum]|uniref:uncharacterized protein LOC134177381 isoform X2 n=1 Tax=Corticium candelabrum TaxID=121492 RepID=UPI002E274387|nr:uncharacterized protein LOC134177381 isoform X2 [Corticium candelabrum]